LLLFLATVCVFGLALAAAADTCKGSCFRGRCRPPYTSAGPPGKQCPGADRKCCIERCIRKGGQCIEAPDGECPEGFKSAGPPGKQCAGKNKKCCIQVETIYANCAMKPNVGNTDEPVTGNIQLSQPVGGELTMKIDLNGFDVTDTDTLHGFHAHAYGDFSAGCGSAGGHFNPTGVKHGAPDVEIRHVGDFGNLKEDGTSVIKTTITDKLATLSGTNSLVGRALVLHASADDLGLGGNPGSEANGNAGPRLACCVVGLAKDPNA